MPLPIPCAQAQRAAAQAALAAACGERRPGRPTARPCGAKPRTNTCGASFSTGRPPSACSPPGRAGSLAQRPPRRRRRSRQAAAFTQLVGQPMDAWNGQPAPASLAGRCLERFLGGIGECREFDLPPLTPENWLAYWQDKSAGNRRR